MWIVRVALNRPYTFIVVSRFDPDSERGGHRANPGGHFPFHRYSRNRRRLELHGTFPARHAGPPRERDAEEHDEHGRGRRSLWKRSPTMASRWSRCSFSLKRTSMADIARSKLGIDLGHSRHARGHHPAFHASLQRCRRSDFADWTEQQDPFRTAIERLGPELLAAAVDDHRRRRTSRRPTGARTAWSTVDLDPQKLLQRGISGRRRGQRGQQHRMWFSRRARRRSATANTTSS